MLTMLNRLVILLLHAIKKIQDVTVLHRSHLGGYSDVTWEPKIIKC